MRALDHEDGDCIVITVTASGGSFAQTDLKAAHSALPSRYFSNLHCMRVIATGVFVVGRVSNGYE